MSATATAEKKERDEELAASRQAALEAYEKLLDARTHFRRAAEAAGMDLRDEALHQLERGQQKADEVSAQASRYVQEKPLSSLGLAFLAGYILAQIFGRR